MKFLLIMMFVGVYAWMLFLIREHHNAIDQWAWRHGWPKPKEKK